jgi:hypothetical protein
MCGRQESTTIQDLPGLPAGVKFDPTDQELLEHLEGKARPDTRKLHPLVDEFIPTIDGENGICYTHPENLPGTYILHVLFWICACMIDPSIDVLPAIAIISNHSSAIYVLFISFQV